MKRQNLNAHWNIRCIPKAKKSPKKQKNCSECSTKLLTDEGKTGANIFSFMEGC